MVKVYVLFNKKLGWKIVKDDKRHVDATKPLFTLNTLKEAIDYCNGNNMKVIRICY